MLTPSPGGGLRGVGWSVAASAAGQGLHLVLRLVLARLLVPADFGVVAMAMAVVSFTWWAQDLSLGQALVQRRTLTDAEKSTAFWANVLAGAGISALLAALAPLVAAFFRTDSLAPVLAAIGLSVALSSPEVTLAALLRREFRFRELALRQLAGVALGGGTGIALAAAGFGAWALVGDALVRAAGGSLLLLARSPWRPARVFSGGALRSLWGFSRPLVGARLVNALNRNVDTVLVGRLLGAAALGAYALAYQFVLLPLTYVSRAVNEAAFASLSRLQDDRPRFAAAAAHALGLVALVTFPLMTLLALAAPVALPWLLGEKWRDAVPLLPFMCLAGAVQSLHSLVPGVLQARGRTDLVLRWVLLTTAATTVAVAAGVARGVSGVAAAYAAATVALSLVVLPALCRGLGLSPRVLLGLVGRPAGFCAAVALVWLAGARLAAAAGVSHPLAQCALLALAGSAVYVALCLSLDPLLRRARSRPLAEAVRLVLEGP